MIFNKTKVLLPEYVYDKIYDWLLVYYPQKSMSVFSMDRNKFDNRIFTVCDVLYSQNKNQFNHDKKKFDFLMYSHFSSGFRLALALNHNKSLSDDLIEEIIKINSSINEYDKLDDTYSFVLMMGFSLGSLILSSFNEKYDTDFQIVSNKNVEGEELCEVSFGSGTMLDLFCLGVYYYQYQI